MSDNAMPSLKDLAAPILASAPAPHGLTLKFGGCRIRVLTNHRPLLDCLRGYYRGFEAEGDGADMTIVALEGPEVEPAVSLEIKEPDPGKTKIKEEFLDVPGGRLVRKRLTGLLFLFGGGLHLVTGPCEANYNQVVNFVNNRHIQWMLDRRGLLFHAAAISRNGAGLALSGNSGMGKSTLALHLMSRGVDFVSNDRLVVYKRDGGLLMEGVAKLPRINPGTALNNPDLWEVVPEEEREMFQGMDTAELWSLEHKYDAYLDRCYGEGRFNLLSPMNGLVVLNWRLNAGPAVPARVKLPDRPELMSAFMKSPGVFYVDSGRGLAHEEGDYLDTLAGVPVLEISGGVDFPAACDACLAFLEEAR